MPSDDLQGKIEFIINQQAQFSSDLERVKDLIVQLAVTGRDRFADHDRKISALLDAQIKSEDRLARLAEAQAQTDQRLRALIDLIREGRNGHNPASEH